MGFHDIRFPANLSFGSIGGRTVIAVLHDLDLVGRHFPQALLLAREAVAWGETRVVLTPETLARARGMIEAFDQNGRSLTPTFKE